MDYSQNVIPELSSLTVEIINSLRKMCMKKVLVEQFCSEVHGAREIGQRGIFGRTAVRKVPDS